MTLYLRELLDKISAHYGGLGSGEMADKLFEIGVIDHTLCKVLVVREYVADKIKAGEKKIDAMWEAAEHFCCTYEYVRKCVYYYTDVNIRR